METKAVINQDLVWDNLSTADREAVVMAFSLLKKWRDDGLLEKNPKSEDGVGDGLEPNPNGNNNSNRIY